MTRYLGGLAPVVLGILITSLLPQEFRSKTPLAVMFLSVMLASLWGGIGPGLLSTAVCVVYLAFGLPPIVGSLHLSTVDQFVLAVFSVVSLAICVLGEGFHRSQRLAREQARSLVAKDSELERIAAERRRAFQNIPEVYAEFDYNWNYVFANPKAAAAAGLTPEDLMGKNLFDVFPEMKTSARFEKLMEASEQRRPVNYEAYAPNIARWFDVNLYPTDTGITLFGVDVTELKEAQEANQKQAIFLRTIADASPIYIAYIDSDYTYRFNSQSYESWFGRPLGEITGHALRGVMGDENFDQIRPYLERAMAGESVTYDRSIEQGGEAKRLRHIYAPDFDEVGTVRGIVSIVSDVTDHWLIEQKLAESEERFRVTLANSPIVVYNQDLELRYTWLGSTDESNPYRSGIGKTDHDLLGDGPEADRLIRLKRGVLESGKGQRAEIFATLGGVKKYFDLSIEPLRDAEGNVIGVGGTAVDITDRKLTQVEKELSDRLAQKRLSELQNLYNNAPAGLCFIDTELRFVRINERLAELNGLPVEEHLGKTIREALQGSDAEFVEGLVISVLETGQPVRNLELNVDLGGGKQQHFVLNYEPVRDTEGRMVGVSAVVQDVTNIKEEEDLALFLGEVTHKLASSFDYAATLQEICATMVPRFADWAAIDMATPGRERPERLAVAHIDPEKILWARQLQDMFPYDADAPYGLPRVLREGVPELYEHIPPELLLEAAKTDEHRKVIEQIGFSSVILAPLIARGRILGALTLVWAESGHHYTEKDLAFVEELARRAALAIDNARLYQQAQDELKERTKVEAQVRRLNQELEKRVVERTSEMQAAMDDLEGFCYSVSHDLRAPMRSISGNSKILLEDFGGELTEAAKDHLRRLDNAAGKMGQLIDDLLHFSRLGRTKLIRERVDVTAVAEGIVAMMRAQHFELNCEVKVQPGMIAMADGQMLGIVLQNLIENACKYSKSAPDSLVEVGTKEVEDETVFYVRDNGIGFDMRYVDKIFQPFERLHRDTEYPGTGIGLANVRRIVSRHHGKVWASAEPGKGATFYFTLGSPGDADESTLAASAPPYLS